ncbi:MAG: hypothetical protein IPJ65_42235 [Archangiaceae bacterium]|nr:hypothetical protein [Archangiaceae bacterium]
MIEDGRVSADEVRQGLDPLAQAHGLDRLELGRLALEVLDAAAGDTRIDAEAQRAFVARSASTEATLGWSARQSGFDEVDRAAQPHVVTALEALLREGQISGDAARVQAGWLASRLGLTPAAAAAILGGVLERVAPAAVEPEARRVLAMDLLEEIARRA